MRLPLPAMMLLCTLCLVAALSACGKKPDLVTTADGEEATEQYPRPYPPADEDY